MCSRLRRRHGITRRRYIRSHRASSIRVSETQTDFMFTPAGLAAPPLGKGLAVFHGSVDGGPPGVFLRSSRGRIIPVDFPSDAHRREARYLAWSTPADFAKPGQYIVVV